MIRCASSSSSRPWTCSRAGGRRSWPAADSFTELFPLFGYDLHDYDSLFAEKLELLLAIRASERVTWSGLHRAPIDDRGVYPRPLQDPLPVWVAIGGTPQSAVRAGVLGLPLALAIIGGQPARFAPFAELHRRASEDSRPWSAALQHQCPRVPRRRLAGRLRRRLAGRAAADEPHRQGTWLHPVTREAYEAGHELLGHTFTGSPAQVIDKILYQHEIFDHDRFLLQFIVGSLEHAKVMRAIELFGTKVAPVVRAEIAKRTA